MSSAPDPVGAWARRLAAASAERRAGGTSGESPLSAADWLDFAAEPASLRSAVAVELKARVDALVRNDPPAALAVAEALVRAAQDLPEMLPLALRGRGAAAHFNGEAARAIADFERAARLYDEDGRFVLAAATRRSLVDVHHLAGNSAAALACAAAACPVLEAHGETRLLAQLLVNMGNVHTRLDDYPAAREHYTAARELFVSLDDAVGRAFADFNLAVVEMNADRIDAAESRWSSAREGMAAAGMALLVADCDYNLAYLQSRRGRFELAIEGLEGARRAYERNRKPSGVPLCDLDLAEIHLRLDARRDACEHAARASARFGELGMDYEQARAEVLSGMARSRLGEHEAAAADLARAGERFARLGNRSFASFVEIQWASLEIEQGAARSASARLASAEATLRERGMPWLADLAALMRARAALACDEPAEALGILAGMEAPRADGSLRDGLLAGISQRLRAEACEAAGDAEGALAALRGAVESIEAAYAHVPAGDVRVAFFRDQHPAFVDLAFALLAAGRQEEALVALEQGRSRSLREPGPAAANDTAEIRAARERLDWLLSRRLDGQLGFAAGSHELRGAAAGGPAGLVPLSGGDRWEAPIESVRAELARLSARRGPSGATTRLTAADLAGARRDEETLVAYMTGRRGIRAFVLTGGHAQPAAVEAVSLPADEEGLAELRDRLLFQLGRLQLGGAYLARNERGIVAALRGVFAELGSRLVQPLVERVPEAFREGRPLSIVPYGRLHDLPFHAFELGGEPLVQRHEVGYALSAWQLARSRRAQRPQHAAARPTSDDEVVWITGSGLEVLPEVERELGSIQGFYGAACRRADPETLCDDLRAGTIRGRILHVAGHGRFEAGHPRFSAICLGGKHLLAHDIAGMRLQLDLVTLSGCETGRKLRIGGDELLGLPRAFLGAGARAVLASHWPVDDGDTARFMESFYGELAAGRSARCAAAAAQRRLRREAAHAWSWASFSLLGDPGLVVAAPAERAAAPAPALPS